MTVRARGGMVVDDHCFVMRLSEIHHKSLCLWGRVLGLIYDGVE